MLAAGAAAWLLMRDAPVGVAEHDPRSLEPAPSPASSNTGTNAHTGANATSGDTALNSEPPIELEVDDVPRIYPPDAAIEDLRDLTTGSTEPTWREWQHATKNALRSRTWLNEYWKALRVLPPGHMRTLGLSALGILRSDAAFRTRVTRAITRRANVHPDDVTGLLLALAYASDPTSKTAKTIQADGYSFQIDTLELTPQTADALASMLTALESKHTLAISVLMHNVEASVDAARKLLLQGSRRDAKDVELRAWVADVVPAIRAALIGAALKHDGWNEQERAALVKGRE